MIVTKEHQEAMVEKYVKDKHTTEECTGFIDGLNAMLELIVKNNVVLPDVIQRNLDIPEEITKEIENYILEHGACGEIEFVNELEEGLEKQESDLTFCNVEYIRQTLNVNARRQGNNVAYCVLYFPWGGGYLKAPYAL